MNFNMFSGSEHVSEQDGEQVKKGEEIFAFCSKPLNKLENKIIKKQMFFLTIF